MYSEKPTVGIGQSSYLIHKQFVLNITKRSFESTEAAGTIGLLHVAETLPEKKLITIGAIVTQKSQLHTHREKPMDTRPIRLDLILMCIVLWFYLPQTKIIPLNTY